MTCTCGSNALLNINGKTYCAGCFDAGVRFGIEHAERIKAIDEELKTMREDIAKKMPEEHIR
jgi:hypothetical protein